MPLELTVRKRWLAVLPLVIALSACGKSPADKEAEAREAAYREKYAKAKALFEERCKTAGVVIKRTVKDVEGIELLKVRPVLAWGDKRYFDPMFDGAAMADEAQGESYTASFLYSEIRNTSTPEKRGQIQPPDVKAAPNQEAPRRGYRFVDTRDPVSGELRRYRVAPGLTEAERRQRGGWAKDIERISQADKPAPFAVDYDDVVDPTDRAYWIAGTRIKVINQQTGEVIAQLTRYVWDRGFGTSNTGRWPWQHASSRSSNICPAEVNLPRSYVTRYFVDTVLIPKQGE